MTYNGAKIVTKRIYAGEWIAHSENFDACEDPDCECHRSPGNHVEHGISHDDAVANWVQWQLDNSAGDWRKPYPFEGEERG